MGGHRPFCLMICEGIYNHTQMMYLFLHGQKTYIKWAVAAVKKRADCRKKETTLQQELSLLNYYNVYRLLT